MHEFPLTILVSFLLAYPGLLAAIICSLLAFATGIGIMLFTRNPENNWYKIAIGFWAWGPICALLAAPIFFGWNWLYFGVLIVSHYLYDFGITVGFHRYLTHGSFQAVPRLKTILLLLGTMGGQGRPDKWKPTHDDHHIETDVPGLDPHTPYEWGRGFFNIVRGLYHAHIGWMLGGYQPRRKYEDDPEVTWFSDRWLRFLVIRLCLPFLVFPVAGLEQAFGAVLWGVAAAFFTLHTTFAVNSVCHVWGKRPFKAKSIVGESTDNWLIKFIALGEGDHNSHHGLPRAAHHGFTKWAKRLDQSYQLIRFFRWRGWATKVVEYTEEQARAENEKQLEAERRGKTRPERRAAFGIA